MPLKSLKKIFKHEEPYTLEKADKIVRELLKSLGTNHKDAKMEMEDENAMGWAIGVGDVIIFIYIFQSEDNELFIKFVSPSVYMPEENLLPFYRRLLEINNKLHDVGFSIENNLVLMFAQRRIELTTIEESKYIIGYLSRVAGEFSKELIEEFKAKPFKVE